MTEFDGGPAVISAGGENLAKLMGRFHFVVDGYDGDPDEIYAIEEVRALYRKLWAEWPYCSTSASLSPTV